MMLSKLKVVQKLLIDNLKGGSKFSSWREWKSLIWRTTSKKAKFASGIIYETGFFSFRRSNQCFRYKN